MGWVGIIGIIVLGALILWLILLFNTFSAKQRRIDEWWDEVDAYLKLRHDLIPLILEKAHPLMTEETPTLERIAEFSKQTSAHPEDEDLEYLENGLSIALQNLKDTVRKHASVMLDVEFLRLMGELVSIEGRASSACKEHNLLVNEFNVSIKRFPAILLITALHFRPREMRIFVSPERERA
jgi:LemA protein